MKLGDAAGDVVETARLVTRLKALKHVVVNSPNGLLTGRSAYGVQRVKFSEVRRPKTSRSRPAFVDFEGALTVLCRVTLDDRIAAIIDRTIACQLQ